jgi:hypothetical protein
MTRCLILKCCTHAKRWMPWILRDEAKYKEKDKKSRRAYAQAEWERGEIVLCQRRKKCNTRRQINKNPSAMWQNTHEKTKTVLEFWKCQIGRKSIQSADTPDSHSSFVTHPIALHTGQDTSTNGCPLFSPPHPATRSALTRHAGWNSCAHTDA